ncbi:MAG: TolC family outer membrane protein [Burkholderiaceae bacterium]|nr:TolC family outer membrane protein [Burkholderiaceae bacterium]
MRDIMLGLALCALLGSNAAALTLAQAIDAARGHDTGYLAAGHARDAGHEKRVQGRAGLLPQAQIDAGYSQQSEPGATYATDVRRHNYDISVTQPIYAPARVATYKRDASLSDAADVEFAKAEQSLVIDVSNAYFDVLFGREALAAAQAAEKAFAQQLKQAQAALKLGEGTRIEVDEAQANDDQAAAQAIAASNDLAISQAAYTRLTGMAPASIEPVQWSCVPPVSADPDAAMSSAATHNLNVRAAQLQVKQAQADVLAARAANLPVANLQASYGTNWSRALGGNEWDAIFGTTSKTPVVQVGVNVTIPVFSGGAGLSQMREAASRREQSDAALEDARRKAREDARTAYLNLTNGQALIHAKERALQSADIKVQSTRMGREVGLRSTIDLLNAQQHYFEAIRDLADARYKFLKARLQLSAALDTLDADTVSLSCGRAHPAPVATPAASAQSPSYPGAQQARTAPPSSSGAPVAAAPLAWSKEVKL